jgi:hypothetical protein
MCIYPLARHLNHNFHYLSILKLKLSYVRHNHTLFLMPFQCFNACPLCMWQFVNGILILSFGFNSLKPLLVLWKIKL